jgi:hypothetical protein
MTSTIKTRDSGLWLGVDRNGVPIKAGDSVKITDSEEVNPKIFTGTVTRIEKPMQYNGPLPIRVEYYDDDGYTWQWFNEKYAVVL